MSKLSVQFHAMPQEMMNLVGDLFADTAVTVIEVVGPPLRFNIWDRDRVVDLIGKERAIVFTLAPPKLNAKSIYEFLKLNPDALVLHMGQVTPAGLSESWLSAMTDNESAMRRWSKTARRLRAATLTGAIAVNPRNEAWVPMRSHRFTLEAQRAFARGLAMLPAAGDSIVKLPLPPGKQ